MVWCYLPSYVHLGLLVYLSNIYTERGSNIYITKQYTLITLKNVSRKKAQFDNDIFMNHLLLYCASQLIYKPNTGSRTVCPLISYFHVPLCPASSSHAILSLI